MKRSVTCFAVVIALVCAPARAGTDNLRAYSIEPACFDLVFTSIVSDSGARPAVAMNDLNGNTLIVRVGDTCRGYTVSDLQRQTESVFDPTVQSHRKRPAHILTLFDGAGKKYELKIGQKLEVPGRMVCLVMLNTGEKMYCREGATVAFAAGQATVQSVSDTSAQVTIAGTGATVALASAEEKASLAQLWYLQRQARTLALTQTSSPQWPEGMAPEDRTAVSPAAIQASSPGRMEINITSVAPGPNSLYPSGYIIAGGPRRGPDGRWVMMPWVLVPAFPRFSTFHYSTR